MKYAFVTGANRGIGRGFVDYLYDEGYFVFGGTRKISDKEVNKDRLQWIVIDVSDDDSVKRAVKEVESKTNKLDLLINNAGINSDSATGGNKEVVCELSKLSRNYLLKMFDVNSVSPMMVVQGFFSLLGGSDLSFVINVSSCRASYHDEHENTNGNYGYRASKIALNMFTFVSLFDLPKTVKIFAVHPGWVKTDMNPEGEYDVYVQAKKMIGITKNWKDEFNGKFMRFDGTLYPL